MRRHHRFLAAAALAVVAGAAALWFASRPVGYAAPAADAPLDFVPADAVGVLSVRVADLWNYPPVKAALQKSGKELPDPLKELSKFIGVGLDEVDRITVIEGSARGPDQEWLVVTTTGAVDKKAVLGAIAPDAKEKTVGSRSYYDNPRGASVAFLNDNAYLIARPDAIQAYLQLPQPARDGPLAPLIKLGAAKHVLVAGVDMAAIIANAPKSAPPMWVTPLLKARLATLTVDLDGQVKGEARMNYANEADAKEAAPGLNDDLKLVRDGFAEATAELTKGGDAPKLAALLAAAQAALKEARAEARGSAVVAQASMKLDPDAIVPALVEGIKRVQKTAKRIDRVNDLKQLTLAAVGYSVAEGKMLPSAITDKNGKPLLSWRVLVLPHVEQQQLYQQFKLDEPWDSDNNKKLIDKMPEVFAPADSEEFKKHETYFQAFVGKGSVFEPGMVLRNPASIPDGTSNTIMFAEAAKSVPWTKPDDIVFDQGKLLQKIGGPSQGGYLASMCDGSVRFLPRSITEDTLRALITRAGGEVIPDLDK